MSAEAGPNWVADGLRQAWNEVRLFSQTALGFTLHPGEFAVEWADGRRQALNPLGFLATAFAIVGPLRAVVDWLTHSVNDNQSLVLAALGALLPFIYYLLLGSLQHVVLRLFGSPRPLRDTCAMALYAGGGPASAVTVLILGIEAARLLTHGQTAIDIHSPWAWVLIPAATVSFGLFMTTISASLAGLHKRHGIRFWHIAVANVVALLGSGLLFGAFHPPGEYGLHFVAGIHRVAGQWKVDVGLGR